MAKQISLLLEDDIYDALEELRKKLGLPYIQDAVRVVIPEGIKWYRERLYIGVGKKMYLTYQDDEGKSHEISSVDGQNWKKEGLKRYKEEKKAKT